MNGRDRLVIGLWYCFPEGIERALSYLMNGQDADRAGGLGRCRRDRRWRPNNLNGGRTLVNDNPHPRPAIRELRSQGLAERGPTSLRGFGTDLVHERAKASKINCVQRAIGRLSTQESLARPIQPAVGVTPIAAANSFPLSPGFRLVITLVSYEDSSLISTEKRRGSSRDNYGA